MITTKDIQKLRAETGFGIIECKKALEQADGDYKKALDVIKKSGAMKAAKRADRETKQGIVEAYVHEGKIAATVVLGCETDFVAKNEQFKELAHNIAMQIASMNPKDNEELLGQSFIKDPSMTIKELIEQSIGKTGENIQVINYNRLSL